MKKNLLKRITSIALVSRICVILLQFIFNLLIPDHQSDGFISPAVNIPTNIFDEFVFWLFGGFFRWDAQYFLHVAIFGYIYENTLAFFPGFPLCVRVVGTALSSIFFHKYLNIVSIYLVSSLIINLIAFVFASRSLFHLTCKTLRNEKVAFLATALFAINPASIFFTAPYSESLYSYLTFQAMLHDNVWISCIFVALSSSVRSNGVVNVGFPTYRVFKKFVNQPINYHSVIALVYKMFFILFISLSVFVIYQIYGYHSFCTTYLHNFDENVQKFAQINSFILRGQNITNMCRSWLPYFYVQKHYWDVGFLHYFRFKQLPNFAVALPIICFSITHCFKYFRQNSHLISSLAMKRSSKEDARINLFPYCVHLISLVVICLFFIHIQVTTRLLCSSSPAVYWFGALVLKAEKTRVRHRIPVFDLPVTLHPLQLYCLSYCIIGTALFCNFYPWT